ncbi:hypothetical protein LCGC14_2678820, partial [marine sediment metagenome]
TRELAFQLSGITAGNTRVLTVQDANGTIALSADLHAQAHAADHTSGADDIQDAASNGSTKGIATFESADFVSTSGKIDLVTSVLKTLTGDSGTGTGSTHSIKIEGGTGITTAGSAAKVVITGHAKYTDAAAISAVEGEVTLDLTGDVSIQDGTASKTLSILVTGDANPKMRLSDDRLEFGSGGASALDTSLKRSAAGIFELERASADIFLQGLVTGDANRRWSLDQTGINFGSGSAVEDVTFGRTTIGTLGVADWFAQSSGILAGVDQTDFVRASAGVSSLALRLFTVVTNTKDANARARYAHDRIEFGAGGASALDVNLYRNAASELKTDDKFLVALDLEVGGNIIVGGLVDGVDIAAHPGLSGVHHTLLHAAAQHNAAVLTAGDNENLGAFYLDIDDIAVPANPGAGIRRLFVNTATGELSVRTNAGATVSLEGAAAGVA